MHDLIWYAVLPSYHDQLEKIPRRYKKLPRKENFKFNFSIMEGITKNRQQLCLFKILRQWDLKLHESCK